ncbi:hypothetical protein KBD61_00635 [Patescibacteria group bacterium]|nr:hypothetical protein [Patescibacteria group bacterium]
MIRSIARALMVLVVLSQFFGCAFMERQVWPHHRRSIGLSAGAGMVVGEAPRPVSTIELGVLNIRRDGWRLMGTIRGTQDQQTSYRGLLVTRLQLQTLGFDATVCYAFERIHISPCLTGSLGRRFMTIRRGDSDEIFDPLSAVFRLRLLIDAPFLQDHSHSREGDFTAAFYWVVEGSVQALPITVVSEGHTLWEQPWVTFLVLFGGRVDFSPPRPQ